MEKIYSEIISKWLVDNSWVNYSKLADKVGYNKTDLSLIQRGLKTCPEHIAERIYKLFQNTAAELKKEVQELTK